MSKQHILLIERDSGKETTFARALQRKGYVVSVFQTGRRALEHAQEHLPTLIVLNAPSLGSSGVRICRSLTGTFKETPVIHILPAGTTERDARQSSAAIHLIMPFTSRKLINRIKRLIPFEEVDDVVAVGKIQFSPELQVVSAYGRETRLTPKAARLLEAFLEHPDQTLARGEIMRLVWDTNYVGDTRTLDVHVRWVRQAIEPNPGKPHHIQTVRGVGYRFVPEPPAKKRKRKAKKQTASKKAEEAAQKPAKPAADQQETPKEPPSGPQRPPEPPEKSPNGSGAHLHELPDDTLDVNRTIFEAAEGAD